jgi:hypothetical protein
MHPLTWADCLVILIVMAVIVIGAALSRHLQGY